MKLTVCRVLRGCDDFDENLTRTRLRYVYEANGDPAFGHQGSSLLDGSHFLRMKTGASSGYYNTSNRDPKD